MRKILTVLISKIRYIKIESYNLDLNKQINNLKFLASIYNSVPLQKA
jgi:hypothetical protein